jgi:hypothetical protein
MPAPSTIEEIIPRLRELPPSLREFLGSDVTANRIGEIAEKYGLTPEVVSRLSRDIAFFVLAFLSGREFIAELQEIAPQGKLADFRKDIAEKIFVPRLRELKDHGIDTSLIAAIPSESPMLAKVKPEAAPPSPPSAPAAPPPPSLPPAAPPPTPPPPPPPITITPSAARQIPTEKAPPLPPKMPAPAPAPAPAPTVAAAPQPPPRPIGMPKITITGQQPGVPPPPAGEAARGEKPEEAPPRPIRYTPPPVIREVPKIIPPAGAPQPSPPRPTAPPPPTIPAQTPAMPKAAIPPQPQKPQGVPVIDLSTFQVTQHTPPPPQADGKTPQPPQPKAKGNVLDLKP